MNTGVNQDIHSNCDTIIAVLSVCLTGCVCERSMRATSIERHHRASGADDLLMVRHALLFLVAADMRARVSIKLVP